MWRTTDNTQPTTASTACQQAWQEGDASCAQHWARMPSTAQPHAAAAVKLPSMHSAGSGSNNDTASPKEQFPASLLQPCGSAPSLHSLNSLSTTEMLLAASWPDTEVTSQPMQWHDQQLQPMRTGVQQSLPMLHMQAVDSSVAAASGPPVYVPPAAHPTPGCVSFQDMSRGGTGTSNAAVAGSAPSGTPPLGAALFSGFPTLGAAAAVAPDPYRSLLQGTAGAAAGPTFPAFAPSMPASGAAAPAAGRSARSKRVAVQAGKPEPAAPSNYTARGRRKCTTERNRDKVEHLQAQLESLQVTELQLAAQQRKLVLKSQVLQTMITIRDDMAQIYKRYQQLKNGTGHVAGQEHVGPVPDVPDDVIMQAATLTARDMAPWARDFTKTCSQLLITYEMAPCDPVSFGLEARAFEMAAQVGVSTAGPSCGGQATAPSYVLQTRMLLALQAAARDAGVATLPPRAAVLEQMLVRMGSCTALFRSIFAVNSHYLVEVAHLNLETLDTMDALGDEDLAALLEQVQLSDEQREVICIAMEHHNAVMAKLSLERREATAALNKCMQTRAYKPTDKLFLLTSSQDVELSGVLKGLQATLNREHNAIYTLASFMMACVLTPIQVIKMAVHSWPRKADALALAITVAQLARQQ